MPTCCINNCRNRTYWNFNESKNIQFHRFPREIAVRQQWLNACQRKESDIKIDAARICSIHFEENCFEEIKILRLKEGSIPTEFLNLEKKQKRRMSQSKEDNKKIKVPKKSSIVPYTEFVQYALQKQRLSQEETVTRMETDVAQNMEEPVKNMESDILQDTKEKVTKNIDKVATQNMEEQSKSIKQQVKQGIDDNLMQLKMSEQRNLKLLDKNQNLEKRIRHLSTQVNQLQAEIKNMTKNIDKVATQNIEEQSKAIKQQIKKGINDNTNYVDVKTLSMQLRKLKELNRKLSNKNRDLSTQVKQLQAEIKNMTKNKYKEARTIAIDTTERLSSEDIARAVSSL
ncbi:uncharacterized protein [Temnothorax nylanderi]|uniref:uncharacterized protein n=1 Tax=Temnothorax nylanderi TaxID=102681 RepID=UPI003A8C186F